MLSIPHLTILFLLTFTVSLLSISSAEAASKTEINAKVKATLTTFYAQVKSGRELANKASAILVFPEVFKAGFVVGGEYGEGAMLEHGKTRSSDSSFPIRV